MQINLEIKLLSEIAILINQELQIQNCINEIPLTTRRIINESSMITKLPIFLLAKSLLRFSDFKSQNWGLIISGGWFSIKQSKTNKIIKRDFQIFLPELKRKMIIYFAQKQNFNYNQIATEILRIVRKNLSDYDLHFKHQTHIFRHIFSTDGNRNGISTQYLANCLGHSNEVNRNSYQHPEICL